jgi:hypothetical protein
MANEVDQNGGARPWLGSDAYNKAAKDRRRTLVVGYLGLLIAILVWAIPAFHKEAPRLITVGSAWFALAIPVTYFRYYTAQRRFQEGQESGFADDGSGVTGFSDERRRILHEMTKNRLIYENQFRNADRNSHAAIILGFIFITGSAVVTEFLAKAPSSRGVFAGVAVVGTVYSAYITKTFFAVRDSALERYDRVSFRIEQEDAFLRAERMVHDTPTLTKHDRLILMKEIFEVRLRAIQMTLENPGQINSRSGSPSRRRKAWPGRRLIPTDQRLVSGSSMSMPPVRSDVQKFVERFLLELGSRLAFNETAEIANDDDDDDEDPFVG